MRRVLPDALPLNNEHESSPRTGNELIDDVQSGIQQAPMAVKLTPHLLSLIDWSDPLHDPLMRQFIPLGSRIQKDHPQLSLDSLDETGDSPVKGVIHRYPDKAVFLGIVTFCSNCQAFAKKKSSKLSMPCVLSLLHTIVYRWGRYEGGQ